MPDDLREEFVVSVGLSVQVSGEKASRQVKSPSLATATILETGYSRGKARTQDSLGGIHLRTSFAIVERVSDSRCDNRWADA